MRSSPLLPWRWRVAILALVVVQFFVAHGLPWQKMFDWDRSILASYATIPFLVLAALLLRREMRWVSWFVNTVEIACYKFGITASFLLVLLIVNDEPPAPAVVVAAPMVRGPRLPEPELRSAPPVTETTELSGRVRGPHGEVMPGALVFVSGLDDYDYARATGTVSIEVGGLAAIELGQRAVMNASDARLHTLVVRRMDDPSHVLFHVPALASGAPALLPFDERSFGVHAVECSIHRNERAYVGVFAHPFFHRVSADGRFTFRRLPLAARKLHAFHPRFREQVLPLQLSRGAKSVEITLGDQLAAGMMSSSPG